MLRFNQLNEIAASIFLMDPLNVHLIKEWEEIPKGTKFHAIRGNTGHYTLCFYNGPVGEWFKKSADLETLLSVSDATIEWCSLFKKKGEAINFFKPSADGKNLCHSQFTIPVFNVVIGVGWVSSPTKAIPFEKCGIKHKIEAMYYAMVKYFTKNEVQPVSILTDAIWEGDSKSGIIGIRPMGEPLSHAMTHHGMM
ncbi:hypothetical protein A2Y83_05245 [Candidatus Falkowbacteria bacterium RBG_13_39_14]|uniref:Uncharacterized protein n=1 Tax=Candidatus Falkowbacteria bacterium RBG_13_39_14 TaxID=1797985 RepID=A0A1F5S4Z4_9BACT|nr:MAG: hypothetical protein A2Y83_05245 [Candidatus Falkowbacteria bacterium RBG_13_39_14]